MHDDHKLRPKKIENIGYTVYWKALFDKNFRTCSLTQRVFITKGHKHYQKKGYIRGYT